MVTLGRGGTDFSAAILARSLDADAVTLFKEVDGLMTADPKSVPVARVCCPSCTTARPRSSRSTARRCCTRGR